MKCHYEVLGLPRDADEATVKKSFRKLALQHHPDKNHGNEEEASKQMIVIQQAYDVLSDKQERAWYDRHREAILRGGTRLSSPTKERGVEEWTETSRTTPSTYSPSSPLPAFRASATMPRVFTRCTETCSPKSPPRTRNSTMPTKKPSSLHSATPQATMKRFVVRAMEKDNKKAREAGRKERNERVRELVGFVRKRDRRVKAYRLVLEAQKEEAKAKADRHRMQQIKAHNEKSMTGVSDAGPSEAHKAAVADIDSFWASSESEAEENPEKEDQEGPDPEQGAEEVEEEEEEPLYCLACEKAFKTPGAMSSHLNSKKHKETLAKLKKVLKEEDLHILANLEISVEEDDNRPRKGKKKRRKQAKAAEIDSDLGSGGEAESGDVESSGDLVEAEAVESVSSADPLETAPVTKKVEKNDQPPPTPKEAACQSCGEEFPSRSRLFAHLEESGHATLKYPLTKAKKKGVNKRLKN